jgi:hypothetical protein
MMRDQDEVTAAGNDWIYDLSDLHKVKLCFEKITFPDGGCSALYPEHTWEPAIPPA